MESTFTIRRCTDVEEACHYFMLWPRQEGWNFCFDTQELRQVFYPCDPNGFFLGTITNKAGQETVVSILLSIRVSIDMGWIGCLIVTKDHRGRGLGSRTLQHGMNYLKGCCFIGVDSFAEVNEMYLHYGFGQTSRSTYDTLTGDMYENVLKKLDPEDYQDICIMDWTGSVYNAEHAHQIVQLEERFLGYNRPTFWNLWLQFYINDRNLYAGCLGRKAAFVLNGDGNVRHFACIQPVQTGYVFSLYSDSSRVAKALLRYLVHWIVSSSSDPSSKWCISKDHPMKVYVNVYGKNSASPAVFESLGFVSGGTMERLFYGKSPNTIIDSPGIIGMMTLLAG